MKFLCKTVETQLMKQLETEHKSNWFISKDQTKGLNIKDQSKWEVFPGSPKLDCHLSIFTSKGGEGYPLR